jgi:hypothetical protein
MPLYFPITPRPPMYAILRGEDGLLGLMPIAAEVFDLI